MVEGIVLIQFIAVSLVVLLVPGPGVLYVVARSISQGHRAGLASVMGLSLGALVHVAAAAFGLSAILLSSATAFSVVKLLGAGYLVYLGCSAFFSDKPILDADIVTKQPLSRIILDGVLISVLNPKIAIFFMAYLPQFIVPSGVDISTQIFLLGIIYVVLAITTDSAYALSAGFIRHRLSRRFMRSTLPRYLSGCLYIGLGVNTALTGRRDL